MTAKDTRSLLLQGLQAAWSLFLIYVVTGLPAVLLSSIYGHFAVRLELPLAISLGFVAVVAFAWLLWLGFIFPRVVRAMWRRAQLFPATPSRPEAE